MKTIPYTTQLLASLLLLSLGSACNPSEPQPAPTAVTPQQAVPQQQAAPFQGTATPVAPAAPAPMAPSQAPLPVIPAGEPSAVPAVPIAAPVATAPVGSQAPLPVIPGQGPAAPGAGSDVASRNRNTWLTSDFRCRAISTVRLRKCRFKETDTGYQISFQNDVICTNVEFDENGHPNKLTGCRSRWLRVPSKNTMKQGKGKQNNTWSGSHGGWRWKDGGKYCCPGMWLEGPKGLVL